MQRRKRAAQSGFELDVIAAVVEAGLPVPERQHPLTLPDGNDIHLDVAWPDVLLAIEPGHSWWHGGDAAMSEDQARDRACARLGWLVIRLDEETRRDLVSAAAEVFDAYETRASQLTATVSVGQERPRGRQT